MTKSAVSPAASSPPHQKTTVTSPALSQENDRGVLPAHPPLTPADMRAVEHLVTEDDTPVDNRFSEKQRRLLTSPLVHLLGRARPRTPLHGLRRCRPLSAPPPSAARPRHLPQPGRRRDAGTVGTGRAQLLYLGIQKGAGRRDRNRVKRKGRRDGSQVCSGTPISACPVT